MPEVDQGRAYQVAVCAIWFLPTDSNWAHSSQLVASQNSEARRS